MIKAIVNRLYATWRFWRYVGLRFWNDNLLTKSAALSFQTALAFVPLLTIAVSLLSAFPIFRGMVTEVQSWLLSILVPHVEEAVSASLQEFVAKARQLTGIGVLAIAIIAMMLLHTVSDALDEIQRVKRQRPLAVRFMAYWTLLTLGPLLLAVGFSLTTSLVADSQSTPAEGLIPQSFNVVKEIARTVVPMAIEWLAFFLLYWLAPSRPSALRDAAAAALLAAVLFQVAKALFALYLVYVATYETIYGAVAVIPISLLWLELAWAIALFGATAAAAMPEWRAGHGAPSAPPPRG